LAKTAQHFQTGAPAACPRRRPHFAVSLNLTRMGTLYYGDNLDILKRYIKDETVDLVYLDPPFNSAQNYNAFFHEKDGTDAAGQIQAFEDTWHWNQESERAYQELVTQPGKAAKSCKPFELPSAKTT
jgi:16S rRNA G966 N2-methylase RsmD